jgi:hypothetical protein
MTEIDVACLPDPSDGSWSCAVRVRDARSTTEHEVAVDEIDLPPNLDGADARDVERLVRATFEFLLEREPKESILRRFDLPVVGRYFPDYPDVIARRLAGDETSSIPFDV